MLNKPKTAKPVPKKLKEEKVPCFKKNKKGDAAEYDRQLQGQQDGLNDMTAQEYLDGRKAYTGKRGSTKGIRDKYEDELFDEYRNLDFSKIEARRLAQAKMKTLNALHNPDMIAAGQDKIGDFGDAGVNKSIGVQWKSRLDELDEAAENAIKQGKGDFKMNASMHRCK